MAQSISFGAYTIHIDGGKLSVLDHNGQVVATADLTADAAAKIALPNGQVLDMGQLADALASDHIADFATAAGGADAAGGAAGSGMFFHGTHAHGLDGFGEMQVIEASTETPGTTPSVEDQQPTFFPETFLALQTAPAGETTPPPSSEQLPVDNRQSHTLPDDTPSADTSPVFPHPEDDSPTGANNPPADNPPANNHASDNAGTGDNTPGDNPPADNPPANNQASDNAGAGDHTPGDNSPADNPPADHAPVAADEVVSTKEDTPLHGSVAATDVDGDSLAYSLVNGPQHGTVSLNSDGTYTYTPDANYNGADSFTYKASDGSLSSNAGTVNLTITPVNDAPIAANATVTTAEDAVLTGHATAIDVDGDSLIFNLENGPQHGTVSFSSDGSYTYTPDADYNGTDSFTYKASDGSLSSNAGTVNLTITPVNDAPIAANATVTTAEDTVVTGHATAIDVDGDNLIFNLVNGPQHGTISFSSDGNYTYTPNADYNGGDSFTFEASDGSLSSNAGTINLTVTPVDDAPVVTADTTVLDHYETLSGVSTQSQTFAAQPHIQITDIDSTKMSSATIDTHGFQHGDTLHINTSSLFDVTVHQTGDDYHISISAKSGSESTADFQNFMNSISFSSTSSQDGVRTLDYTVTDDQHVTSNAAHATVNIQGSYEVWSSQLAPNQNSLGSGDDILHLDGKFTGKFDMGAGDDTVHFDVNNGTLNHQMAPNLQNIEHIDTTGAGKNTVSLSISDVLNMTDDNHLLTIVGDKSDTVNLTGDNSSHHWQQTGSHDGFNVYTWSDPNHAAVVEISQIMHQSAT